MTGILFHKRNVLALNALQILLFLFFFPTVANAESMNVEGATTASLNLIVTGDSATTLGAVQFFAKDSITSLTEYLRITGCVDDSTDGSEDGQLELYGIIGGAWNKLLGLNADGLTLSQGDLDVENGSVTADGLTISGAASAATLDTGYGANELFDMDQHVQTTNAVTFAGLTITGQDSVTIDGYLKAEDSGGIGLKDDAGNLGVWVEDGGNVGIGTTNPSAKLEVIGQITADQINLGDEEEIKWMGSETLRYSDSGMEFYFSKGIQTASGNVTAASDLQANGDAYIGINTADSKLWYHDTEYLMWDNYPGTFILSDDLYVAGEVGIGTASPSVELDVDGDAYFSGDVKINGLLDYGGGGDPPYILWFDETREHVAELCKASIPESNKNGLVQFYNSVQDRIEYFKPANGKVYIQDGGGSLIEQATLDGGPFYTTYVIPRYAFNRRTGEVARFDKSNTKRYEIIEGYELDEFTGEFVDDEGQVVSPAIAIREKTDEKLTSETLIQIKERILAKDPWIETTLMEATEEVAEMTDSTDVRVVTKYRLNPVTGIVESYQIEEEVRTKVPTGNTIYRIKADCRLDEATGVFYRLRTPDDVTLE